jgi:hypothetical protein
MANKMKKSFVRVKSWLLVSVAAVGIAQAFSFVPWSVENPMEIGVLLAVLALYLGFTLPCEKCGWSIFSAFSALEKFGYADRRDKTAELKKRGIQLAPFRKHCIFCGMERL